MRKLTEENLIHRIKAIKLRSIQYIAPFYLLFGLLDYFYYNQFFHFFITLRCLAVALIILLSFQQYNLQQKLKINLVTSFIVQLLAQSITYMIFIINDHNSPYYMGMLLVILLFDVIFKLDWSHFLMNLVLILLPLFLLLNPQSFNQNDSFNYLQSLFILFSSFGAIFIKSLNHQLFKSEYLSRELLNKEVIDRNKIIEEKVNEIVNINNLAKQFSPQVLSQIKKIKEGEKLEETSTRDICVLFVDIVDSTKKINKISNKDFNLSINKFIEITTKALLVHEITIDKFLGDGFLAFSNAPFKVPNYIEKVFLASIQILKELESNQSYFKKHWNGTFSIRIGIDAGESRVGFIGTHEQFKTYSAIGLAVNKASRLCSKAKPENILLTKRIWDKCKNLEISKNLSTKEVLDQKLKGFENEEVFYSISYSGESSRVFNKKGQQV